jgi:hypothetical protein
MALNNPSHRGQSYAGSNKFLVGMESLEWGEKFIGLCHVETSTIVPDVKNSLSA